MKPKAIIPLVLGLCVGLIAVKYLVETLQNARGSPTEVSKITVVRARQDIGSAEEITAEMVELVETADNAFIPSSERIAKIEDVAGRVTAKAVPRHSPVLKSMLAAEGTVPGMAGRIPPGFRAVSIKIDEVTGVAYQLKPGAWVDVIVVMDVDTGGRRRKKETMAEVILQHVEVLAIGRTAPGDAGDSGRKAKPAKSATLLVSEKDVPKLHLAATRGKLTLALRGKDNFTTDLPGFARGGDLLEFTRRDRLSSNLNLPFASSTPAEADTGPGFLGSFLATAASPHAQPPQPRPRLALPHGVTLYHGSATGGTQVQQLVFENGRSRTVVAISSGPISRTHAATTIGSDSLARPGPWEKPEQSGGSSDNEPDDESDTRDEEAE